MSESWNDLKKVREEEYFLRQEQEKIARLKESIAAGADRAQAARDAFGLTRKATSPLTGAVMFQATVAGRDVLDCTEEKTILLSYETLDAILSAVQNADTRTLERWKDFLAQDHTHSHETD